MKEKVKNIGVVLILIIIIEFGLIAVGLDATSTDNYETRDISFWIFFIFPLILILAFFEQLAKFAIYISLIISTALMVYFSIVYKLEMLDSGMLVVLLGYGLILGLSGYFSYRKRKIIIVSKI